MDMMKKPSTLPEPRKLLFRQATAADVVVMIVAEMKAAISAEFEAVIKARIVAERKNIYAVG